LLGRARERVVQDLANWPCNWSHGTTGSEQVAVFGDDGRYHLYVGEAPLCGSRRTLKRAGKAEVVYRHVQSCPWLSGALPARNHRLVGTADDPALRRVTIVRWDVRLTEATSDPTLVPVRERCHPYDGWPPHHTLDTPLGRIRSALIATLGAWCHGCGRRVGVTVDHDHFTGMVRGLLCRHCNTHIDGCPHVTDCPWADYLDSPPAAGLQLRHPKADGDRHKSGARTKIEYLGFDPFPPRRRGGQR
jgi:hypothetical protein